MITKNSTRFQSKNTCLKTIHVGSVIYGQSSWLCTKNFLKEFSHLFWYFWFRKYSVFRRKLFLFSFSFSFPPSFLVNILSFFLHSPSFVVIHVCLFMTSQPLQFGFKVLCNQVPLHQCRAFVQASSFLETWHNAPSSLRVDTERFDLSSLCFCADCAELSLHLFQEVLSFLPTSPQLLQHQ